MKHNPVSESIEYLVNCGWKKEEASNLIRAIYHKDADKLWETAPKWIEEVGKAKEQMALYETVAMGLVNVTRADDDSDWMYALKKEYVPQEKK